jgi:putative methylase
VISSKSRLSKTLSTVKSFVKPKLRLRQYLTPPVIAAELLWTAYMNDDISGKIVFDLGAGTGMLSIGASLLDGDVTGFEFDGDAIKVAIINAQLLGVNIIIFEQDVDSVTGYCDTVIMNPPFMVQGGKNDRVFLKKAFSLCSQVYSIHNSQTRDWVKQFALENGFNPILISSREFPLPKEYAHQSKLKGVQRVDLWFFHKV